MHKEKNKIKKYYFSTKGKILPFTVLDLFFFDRRLCGEIVFSVQDLAPDIQTGESVWPDPYVLIGQWHTEREREREKYSHFFDAWSRTRKNGKNILEKKKFKNGIIK